MAFGGYDVWGQFSPYEEVDVGAGGYNPWGHKLVLRSERNEHRKTDRSAEISAAVHEELFVKPRRELITALPNLLVKEPLEHPRQTG